MTEVDWRIEASGPRRTDRGHIVSGNPKPYNCVYCGQRIDRAPQDFKLCQNRECIEAAILDRATKFDEVMISIDQFRLDHDKEANRLLETIEKLKLREAESSLIAQYESLHYSWTKFNRFHGLNNRQNLLLRLQAEVAELAGILNRPAFSDEFRREIWERDRRKCYLCGRVIQDSTAQYMHIDHVVPRSQGGSDEEHNLRAVHPTCNWRKSDHNLSSRKMAAVLNDLRKSEEDRQKGLLF